MRKRCFAIFPFDPEFFRLFDDLIEPVCRDCGVEATHLGVLEGGKHIHENIWTGIIDTDFAIADLTGQNPNVMYEVGLCHATDKPVIPLAQEGQELPFDMVPIKALRYEKEFTQPQWDEFRKLLKNSIISTLRNPRAGDKWIFHSHGFGLPKRIREVYFREKHKLSLVSKWYHYVEKDLLVQIDSQEFKILEADFADIDRLFLDAIEEGDQILATCFTEMATFYFKRGVGEHYIRLNETALQDRKVTIKRIFGVDSGWERTNILLRDLIRLYGSMQMEVLTVDNQEVDKQLRDRDDFFLICDKEGQPKGVIDFEISSRYGGISSVIFKLNETELRKKKNYFNQLLTIAKQPSGIPLEYLPPSKLNRAVVMEVVQNMIHSLETENTNLLSYLRKPSKVYPTDVSKYWSGLEGSLIRPASETLKHLEAVLRRHVEQRVSGNPRALILGSTPEVRILAHQIGFNVEVVDNSTLMFEGMSEYIERRGPQEIRYRLKGERFHCMDWRNLNLLEPAYDVVLGIDVPNMLDEEGLRALFRGISHVMNPSGVALLQWVQIPGATYLAASAGLTQKPPHDLGWVYQNQKEKLNQGTIDLGEMFARLCFSQYDPEKKVIYIGQVVEYLEQRIIYGDPTVEVLCKTYAQCNTKLHLHRDWDLRHATTESGLTFSKEPVVTNKESFKHLFAVAQLYRSPQ